MVICLERGADLHMAQQMPLPLTVSCFSKIQFGFTFLVPAHPCSPGQRAVKRVCVCMWIFLEIVVDAVSAKQGLRMLTWLSCWLLLFEMVLFWQSLASIPKNLVTCSKLISRGQILFALHSSLSYLLVVIFC